MNNNDGIIGMSNGVFEKRNIGVGVNDLLTPTHASTLYSSISHAHPEDLRINMETQVAESEVIFRHIFTRPFSFAADFAGIAGRSEFCAFPYVMTIWLQNNAGSSFETKGTITININNTITAQTVSNAPFTAPIGSVLKITGPSVVSDVVGFTASFASV